MNDEETTFQLGGHLAPSGLVQDGPSRLKMVRKRRVLAWCHPGVRILWCIVLAGHAWAMTLWWWPMRAHGFPITHLRFWMNQALPWILSALCLAGMVLAWRRQSRLFSLIVLTIPIAYASAVLAGLLVFPESAVCDVRRMLDPSWLYDSFLFRYGLWLPFLLWAASLGLLAVFTVWRRRGPPAVLGLAAATGACLGFTFIWALRAEDPSTYPAGQMLPSLPEGCESMQPDQVFLADDMTLDYETGTVRLSHQGLEIAVRSTLAFYSVSLERGWTLFASPQWRKKYKIRFASVYHHQDEFYLKYEGGNQALVRVKGSRQKGEPVEIETWTSLPEPVFSHLDSFTEVSVGDYNDLSISLSPFPEERFELRRHSHPDYWIHQGFAYVDAHNRFHWAKGAREEHGPFRYLAHGRLAREDPLILTIFNEDRAVCRITLYDWSEQASTALSPTAGWGVPANAVEAFVGPTSKDNVASIVFQLAATSIGRGYDTVGHKAGAYRNRMTIELF